MFEKFLRIHRNEFNKNSISNRSIIKLFNIEFKKNSLRNIQFSPYVAETMVEYR